MPLLQDGVRFDGYVAVLLGDVKQLALEIPGGGSVPTYLLWRAESGWLITGGQAVCSASCYSILSDADHRAVGGTHGFKTAP